MRNLRKSKIGSPNCRISTNLFLSGYFHGFGKHSETRKRSHKHFAVPPISNNLLKTQTHPTDRCTARKSNWVPQNAGSFQHASQSLPSRAPPRLSERSCAPSCDVEPPAAECLGSGSASPFGGSWVAISVLMEDVGQQFLSVKPKHESNNSLHGLAGTWPTCANPWAADFELYFPTILNCGYIILQKNCHPRFKKKRPRQWRFCSLFSFASAWQLGQRSSIASSVSVRQTHCNQNAITRDFGT